ncbi:MAG: anti-sigma factor antagonist [Chitinivibrionales bacterium]|nr:anti-sigma factor antagonist [Chitinivibrionales bacterium]
MNKLAEIHKKVLRGMVLNEKGQWVFHKDLVQKRTLVADHVEQGRVLIKGKWVTLEEALTEDTSGEFGSAEIANPSKGQATVKPKLQPVGATAVTASQKGTGGPAEAVSSPGGDLLVSTNEMAAVFWVVDQEIPVCSVRLGGHIDQSNSRHLKKAFESLYTKGYLSIILDMSRLEYLSSAGWGIIAAENKRLETAGGGLLVLCAMKGDVASTFKLLQFDKILPAHTTVAESLRFVKQKQAKHVQSAPGASVNVGSQDDPADMSIYERCKRIIADNGPMKTGEVRKLLMTKQYGGCKIGLIKLYFLLREMNLHSLDRQKRFYRSC